MRLKSISINFPSHQAQRYNTVGDWYKDNVDPNYWVIKVSRMTDWRSEVLVAIHELVEMALCQQLGIAEEVVSDWDLAHPELEEPGDEPLSPYNRPHRRATHIEREIAQYLGLSWKEHEENCNRASAEWKRRGETLVAVDPPPLPEEPF